LVAIADFAATAGWVAFVVEDFAAVVGSAARAGSVAAVAAAEIAVAGADASTRRFFGLGSGYYWPIWFA